MGCELANEKGKMTKKRPKQVEGGCPVEIATDRKKGGRGI